MRLFAEFVIAVLLCAASSAQAPEPREEAPDVSDGTDAELVISIQSIRQDELPHLPPRFDAAWGSLDAKGCWHVYGDDDLSGGELGPCVIVDGPTRPHYKPLTYRGDSSSRSWNTTTFAAPERETK